jgi:hypothetical protein
MTGGQNMSCTSRKKVAGKGGRRVKECVHRYANAKMILVETIPGIQAGGIRYLGF